MMNVIPSIPVLDLIHLYAILTLLTSYLILEGEGHIGSQCTTIFSTCRVSAYTYCDENNICRCKPHYPVVIMPHTCKKAKKYGERCSTNAECTYHDIYSYCEQDPIRRACYCISGYEYDRDTEVCQKEKKNRRQSPGYLLPTTLGLIFACCSILCCCLAVCHFCRRHIALQQERWLTLSRWSMTSRPRQREQISARHVDRIAVPPTDNADTLPSYEAVVFSPSDDQAPPPYEEAIKSPPIPEIKV